MNKIQGESTVVHITNSEDHSKLKAHFPLMRTWEEGVHYYLVSKTNTGFSNLPYEEPYISLEFEDVLLIPEKWSLYIDGNPQEFIDWLPEDLRSYYSNGDYYFQYPNFEDGEGFRKGCHSSGNVHEDYEEISYKQFLGMLETEAEVPKFWHIFRNQSNASVLNNWENERRGPTKKGNPYASRDSRAMFCNYGNYGCNKRSDSVEITLEQFIKFTKINMKYKFKEDFKGMQSAADAITGTEVRVFVYGSFVHKRLEAAGVLDIWFEKDSTPSIGDWVKIEKNPDIWSSEFSNKDATLLAYPFVGQVEKINHKSACISGYGFSLAHTAMVAANAAEVEERNTVKIGSYTSEKVQDGVQFGCQTISNVILVSLLDLLERKEFEFKATVDGVEITAGLIKKLL